MLHLICEDGNKELKHRIFPLGRGIKKHLQKTLDEYNGDKTIEGYKRLVNLLSMDGIKYNEMKRLKNFFDNYVGTNDNVGYMLNGGDKMKNWVNNTLQTATENIYTFKKAQQRNGIQNAFIKTHEKNRKPNFKSNLNQDLKDKTKIKTESNNRIIVISEHQVKLLKEAASNNFSLKELSQINSFKGRYQYCIKQLGPTQGRGSSRVVFQIDDNNVLKLALNNKGLTQNNAEDDGYLQQTGITPKIYENDNDYKWLVSEFVLPAKQQDFKQCIGLSFEEFCQFIRTSFKERFGKRTYGTTYTHEQYCDLVENNETCYDFDDYIGNFEPPMGDLLRIANYGMVKRDGYIDIVLLDSGLSLDIWNNYYR